MKLNGLLASIYTPGDMLDGILEENQLGLLGEGHVVIIEVVLEDSLDLIHVRQILIQTVLFFCTHLIGFLRKKAGGINKGFEVFQCKHRNQMFSEPIM